MSAAGAWWLRLAVKALLVVLVFALEVRVHAGVEEPEGCWQGAGACAVRSTNEESLRLQMHGISLVLDEGSTVVRLAADQLRLLAGTVWLKVDQRLMVVCEFGEFALEKGEYWISRTRERVTAAAVQGRLVMKPRGKRGKLPEELEVAAGLENWMGRVQAETGQAQTGAPMPIPLKPHLARWARLFKGTRDDFTQQAQKFHEIWSQAARESAEIHHELVERKLAAIDGERARAAEETRRIDARNRELVEMLMRRAFDP